MHRYGMLILAGALLVLLHTNAQTQAPNEGRQQPGPQLKIESGVEFSQGLKLDLYRMLPAANPLPLVIWIHGQDGPLATRLATPAAALASANGYAIASIDYRSGAGITRAQQLSDVKAAIAFLRSNAGTYS